MPNELCSTLCHYGVMGQKWGIRRFQPYPKNYHGAGKYTGKEIQSAKSKRHKAISEATLSGMAKNRAKTRYDRRLSDKEATIESITKAKKDYEYWQKKYSKTAQQTKKLVASLQKKYGKTAISDIPYRDETIRGKVFTTKEVIARGAITVGTLVIAALPGPGTLELSLFAVPSKTVQSMMYAVKEKRADGEKPVDSVEKVLFTVQNAVDKMKDKVITRS